MSAPDVSLLGKRRFGPLFALQFAAILFTSGSERLPEGVVPNALPSSTASG